MEYTAMREELEAKEGLAGTVALVMGTVILTLGAVSLGIGILSGSSATISSAYGVTGTGLGFAAVGLGFIADHSQRETQRSQIDEKIAMIYSYLSDPTTLVNLGGKVLADLRSLERVAQSATRSQACQMATEGKKLVDALKTKGVQEADDAQRTIIRILERHHLTL